jgi:hypothetical protein
MIGRQISALCTGYQVTGDPALLDEAGAGVRWLIDHGWDHDHGGWWPRLRRSGDPAVSSDPRANDRTAQDAAYCALGLAAWFNVTRDPEAEAYLLKTEGLLFDPKFYWDAAHSRVRDALDPSLSAERDMDGGGWDLVAGLDQLNGYLVLAQPLLTRKEDRDRWADHLAVLGRSLKETFWKDGLFWGQKDFVGRPGGTHVDFGHHFKSLWMLAVAGLRGGDANLAAWAEAEARRQLPLALDPATGLWRKSTLDWKTFEAGSDWWTFAEDDQLAAWLDVTGGGFTACLAVTAQGWLDDYVDHGNGEVWPSIRADGSKAWNWGPRDTAKANEWKNGFHSTEHALVLYLHGAWLEGTEAELHYAFPAGTEATATATPYLFPGVETGRSAGTALPSGLVPTTVRFRLGR